MVCKSDLSAEARKWALSAGKSPKPCSNWVSYSDARQTPVTVAVRVLRRKVLRALLHHRDAIATQLDRHPCDELGCNLVTSFWGTAATIRVAYKISATTKAKWINHDGWWPGWNGRCRSLKAVIQARCFRPADKIDRNFMPRSSAGREGSRATRGYSQAGLRRATRLFLGGPGQAIGALACWDVANDFELL